ncbi:unnamed protein product [Nesidiocoris tenuis]|uniref:CBM20 domain-containing protein n=1 Tax=Nesidiocoris tenuis TaxID=355587 RepID=A0A6H5G5S3_9HEMI|nr:unnamed protein product [Nesidiocoris tenuis]
MPFQKRRNDITSGRNGLLVHSDRSSSHCGDVMVVILIVGGEQPSPVPSSTTVSITSSGSQVSPDEQIASSKEVLKKNTYRILQHYVLRGCISRMVQAETQDSERLAVTGSCKELGSWETDALLLLDREGDSSIWSKTVALQSNSEIKYRYVIVTDDSQSEEFVKTKETEPLRSVRRWEASEDPRRIEPMGENLNVTSTKRELYLKMSADDIRRLKQSRADIERCAIEEFHNSEAAFGWLTNDIALHFKLFAKSVELFDRRLRDKPLYVKLRMIPIVPGCSTNVDYYRDGSKGWPVVEVSVLDEGRRRFRRQPEYGTPICPTMDNVIYQINAGSITGTGIVFDFHHYKKEGDIKPIHFGFSCLHPCKLGNNEGQLTTEICNIRDEIIGRVKLSYVFIFPTPTIKFKLHHSLSASWSKIWFGRDTQGRKISVVKRCVGTRNNRIYCIESTRHDVDYVRITVQFSKDSIPVFGHSPYLVVALKNPEDPFPLEQYQIRVEDMTVAQLQRMAIPPEKCSGHSDIPDHKNPLAQQNWPFPSLVQLLNGVNRNVGFLIELVTTNQLIDGSYHDRHDYDVNKHVVQSQVSGPVSLTFTSSRLLVQFNLQWTCPLLSMHDRSPHSGRVHDLLYKVCGPQGAEEDTKNRVLLGTEEWVTRKKVEVVTKRQIATRVQREVLLEDGKVVQDTGPKVTTTTTEDTHKNESENTEYTLLTESLAQALVDTLCWPMILTVASGCHEFKRGPVPPLRQTINNPPLSSISLSDYLFEGGRARPDNFGYRTKAWNVYGHHSREADTSLFFQVPSPGRPCDGSALKQWRLFLIPLPVAVHHLKHQQQPTPTLPPTTKTTTNSNYQTINTNTPTNNNNNQRHHRHQQKQ